LEEIKFDRGWDQERLSSEMFQRKVVLAYLIDNGLNTYTEAAATLQAFINDPDSILGLIANDRLAESLDDLRGMESVLIDTDPAAEAMVPRPDPNEELQSLTEAILEEADDRLFDEYREAATPSLTAAFADGGEPSEARRTSEGERSESSGSERERSEREGHRAEPDGSERAEGARSPSDEHDESGDGEPNTGSDGPEPAETDQSAEDGE
jgi:flagellar protein FlaI